MRLYVFIIIFFCFNNSLIKSQVSEENHIKPDTTIETIIYEYDTVYIAPDTVKLTDTIINYLPAKKKIKKHHWSLELGISPFVSNIFNEKSSIDSFSYQKIVNYSFDVNLQYAHKNYIIGIGAGIMPLHERIHYQSSYRGTTSQQDASLSYDSLQVNYNCTSDNYFNYFNVYLSFGRKWMRKKVDYGFNASFMTDILIDYKAFLPLSAQVENRIKASSVRKLGLAAALSPYMGYRFGKKLELFLALFYKYTFNKDHKYPQNNLRNIGIGTGFNLIL